MKEVRFCGLKKTLLSKFSSKYCNNYIKTEEVYWFNAHNNMVLCYVYILLLAEMYYWLFSFWPDGND